MTANAPDAWRLFTLRELATPAEALLRRLQQLQSGLPAEAPPAFARAVGQMNERAAGLLDMVRAALTPGAPAPADPKFRHDLRSHLALLLGLCDLWRRQTGNPVVE